MTINEAISQADDLCTNAYNRKQKIVWLSRMESMIHRTVLSKFEPDITVELDPETGEPIEGVVAEEVLFEGFDEKTDPETELTIPSPWDDAYIHWIQAQIHLANNENDLFNASATMYSASFEAWKGWYCQNHMPKTSGRFRF